jgi:EpsI family protein
MSIFRWSVSSQALGVAFLLTATLAASRVTSYRNSATLAAPLDSIPFTINGFAGTPNRPLEDAVLRELKATSYISRHYVKDTLEADVFAAYYAEQRAGESMHSPKHCLPGAGWEIWNYDTVRIPAGSGSSTINKYSISQAGDRRVVLYWYQSRERIFASEYMGKLLLARDALLQNSTAASIVRVIVRDEPAAVESGAGIASELMLHMQRCFGR